MLSFPCMYQWKKEFPPDLPAKEKRKRRLLQRLTKVITSSKGSVDFFYVHCVIIYPLLICFANTNKGSIQHFFIFSVFSLDEGDPVYQCRNCGSMMWYAERIKKDDKSRSAATFSMCCLNGKVVLPMCKPPPQELHRLFFDKDTQESKNFIENIRQYNNMFSFTSFGGKINHALNSGGAPYTFSLSGMNYHSIGNLLPPQGAKPVFSQLYIHDTDNEIHNRISAVR